MDWKKLLEHIGVAWPRVMQRFGGGAVPAEQLESRILTLEGDHCSACFSVSNGVLTICGLETDKSHQRQGKARKLMKKLCLTADQFSLQMELIPRPMGYAPPVTVDQLIAFYREFGFSGTNEKMLRMPCFLSKTIEQGPVNKQDSL